MFSLVFYHTHKDAAGKSVTPPIFEDPARLFKLEHKKKKKCCFPTSFSKKCVKISV